MMTVLLRFFQRIFKASPESESGFSVLEAMIAIAILAAALIPLLTLQGQFIRSVESFERADVRLEVRDSALTLLNSLNLMDYPNGTLDLGRAQMTWRATLAGPAKMSRGDAGTEGRFEMALYDVNVTLTHETNQTETFSVRGLGWRPVVAFSPE